jgi:hypothetical protein
METFPKIYGISQDPDTKYYIIVLQDRIFCEICSQIYTHRSCKWCKPCQTNNLRQNFAKWTSGNYQIDEFIQEMQLKINDYGDIIVEWIPYNQFNEVKKIGKDNSISMLYSAIWKDGLFKYNHNKMEYNRIPNREVTLKYLGNNSQNNNITNEIINKV